MDKPILICLSHLRWNFVYQRPQHLMVRHARLFEVIFLEEPVFEDVQHPRIERLKDASGVLVVRPVLPFHPGEAEQTAMCRQCIDGLLAHRKNRPLFLWYCTPMALPFTRHLQSSLCVYDCMDELSNFRHAPTGLKRYEMELFARADLVFAGGESLYQAKRPFHPNVFSFPSGVDIDHFKKARALSAEPDDQQAIPKPRLGFFGVIDERFDIELIQNLAQAKPDWHLVLIGPVAKIDQNALPRAPNIHYLGCKNYALLPNYIAGWDVALLPFALNEATRYISPTKTPEYLAAGKPVISTPIRDVVQAYGEQGLVEIAGTANEIIEAVSGIAHRNHADWLKRVDGCLTAQSWDKTWPTMIGHMQQAHARKEHLPLPRKIAGRRSEPAQNTQTDAAA